LHQLGTMRTAQRGSCGSHDRMRTASLDTCPSAQMESRTAHHQSSTRYCACHPTLSHHRIIAAIWLYSASNCRHSPSIGHTLVTETAKHSPSRFTQTLNAACRYAAGNNVPTDCTVQLTTSNYHNQLVGSYVVNQSSLLVAAAASPKESAVHVVGKPYEGRTKPSPEKIWAMHTPVSFSEAKTTSRAHATLPGVTVLTTTYLSTPIPLASGQIAWT
jgi:hypothetical protein